MRTVRSIWPSIAHVILERHALPIVLGEPGIGALPAQYGNDSIDGEQCQDHPSQKNRPIIRHQLIQGSPKRTPRNHRHMGLVPSAADDDTDDSEQDECDAGDDEPMRKLELFHKSYVLHPSRLSPSARFRRGGGWPRACQQRSTCRWRHSSICSIAREDHRSTDLDALSGSRAAAGFFGHIFSC